MTEDQTTLTAFYKGWDIYQQHLTRAIAPLSPDQLALQAAPNLRSIGVLAAHIIAARVLWFHFVMGEGSKEILHLCSSCALLPLQRGRPASGVLDKSGRYVECGFIQHVPLACSFHKR